MPSVRFRCGAQEATCAVPLPNSTTLQELLQDAKPRLGLAPSSSCQLRHRGKAVDLGERLRSILLVHLTLFASVTIALPWRLTGLVSNTVLDVVPADPSSSLQPPAALALSKPAPSSMSPPPTEAARPVDPPSATGHGFAAALAQMRAEIWDTDAKTAVLTLAKIVRNIVAQPWEEKYRTLRVTNPAFRQKLANSNAALGGSLLTFFCKICQ